MTAIARATSRVRSNRSSSFITRGADNYDHRGLGAIADRLAAKVSVCNSEYEEFPLGWEVVPSNVRTPDEEMESWYAANFGREARPQKTYAVNEL